MNYYVKNKLTLIEIFGIILIFLINGSDIEDYNGLKFESDEISIVINLQHLTKAKHQLFNEIMIKINSKRNIYFIKSNNISYNSNIDNLINNSFIKIVQSNFPDSIFLPLAVSLYGNIFPSLVLLIEGEEINDNCGNELIEWINNAYNSLIKNNYDYIFGNFQYINGNKIGCTILLSNYSIIEHLLYYTNSDTSHMHPFIQLSLATKTNFVFIKFKYTYLKKITYINKTFSSDINCPLIHDNENSSLCLVLPTFKRNYLNYSFNAFSNQTYKPKLYLIIQNEDRIHYNLSLIQQNIREPIFHIWMKNWNSFFFLNHRIFSLLPCNFILKYDDDQWPLDSLLHEKLINLAKNQNNIIGGRGYSIKKSYCGYKPKKFLKLEDNEVDHAATPLLIRPSYLKLDARNYIYRIYGGEDISLSLNSYKLCNVITKTVYMNLTQFHSDGNNQRNDKQIISQFKKERKNNFNLFKNSYCFLISSGYIPRRWINFQMPEKKLLRIIIKHKSLN